MDVKIEARHGAAEHVRDEELRMVAFIVNRHVPRAIDERMLSAGPLRQRRALVVQYRIEPG